ncbi:hypothetical protein ES703_114986 [subsurface metagenome]
MTAENGQLIPGSVCNRFNPAGPTREGPCQLLQNPLFKTGVVHYHTACFPHPFEKGLCKGLTRVGYVFMQVLIMLEGTTFMQNMATELERKLLVWVHAFKPGHCGTIGLEIKEIEWVFKDVQFSTDGLPINLDFPVFMKIHVLPLLVGQGVIFWDILKSCDVFPC